MVRTWIRLVTESNRNKIDIEQIRFGELTAIIDPAEPNHGPGMPARGRAQ